MVMNKIIFFFFFFWCCVITVKATAASQQRCHICRYERKLLQELLNELILLFILYFFCCRYCIITALHTCNIIVFFLLLYYVAVHCTVVCRAFLKTSYRAEEIYPAKIKVYLSIYLMSYRCFGRRVSSLHTQSVKGSVCRCFQDLEFGKARQGTNNCVDFLKARRGVGNEQFWRTRFPDFSLISP